MAKFLEMATSYFRMTVRIAN